MMSRLALWLWSSWRSKFARNFRSNACTPADPSLPKSHTMVKCGQVSQCRQASPSPGTNAERPGKGELCRNCASIRQPPFGCHSVERNATPPLPSATCVALRPLGLLVLAHRQADLARLLQLALRPLPGRIGARALVVDRALDLQWGPLWGQPERETDKPPWGYGAQATGIPGSRNSNRHRVPSPEGPAGAVYKNPFA